MEAPTYEICRLSKSSEQDSTLIYLGCQRVLKCTRKEKKTFPFASASPYPDNVQINSINKQDILLSAMDDPFQAGFKYLQADFLTE